MCITKIRHYFATSLGTNLGFTILRPCRLFGLDIWSYAAQLDEKKLVHSTKGRLFLSDRHHLPTIRPASSSHHECTDSQRFILPRFWFILLYMIFNHLRFQFYIICTVKSIPISDRYLDTYVYFCPFPMYLNVASAMSSLIILRTLFSFFATTRQPLNPKTWWIYIFTQLDSSNEAKKKQSASRSPLCLPLKGAELYNFRIIVIISYIILIISILSYDILAAANELDTILRNYHQPLFFPYILLGLLLFHIWFTLAFRLQLYLIMLFLFICRYLQLLARQLKHEITTKLMIKLEKQNSQKLNTEIASFNRMFLIFSLHLCRFNAGFWSRFFLYNTGFGTPELLAITYMVLNAKLLPIPFIACVGLCFNFYLLYITLYIYSARVNKIIVDNYRLLCSFSAKLFCRDFSRLTICSLTRGKRYQARCSLAMKIKLCTSIELMSSRYFPIGIQNGALFTLMPLSAFKFALLAARFYLLCDKLASTIAH